VKAPRVLLADADVPTRAGLRVALQAGGLEVVAEVEDSDAAVAAAVELSPDLGLLASQLPADGLATVGRISKLRPGMRLVVLTAEPSGGELLAAVLAGAAGYLTSDMRPARLPDALSGVLAGEVALPRRHSALLLDELRGRKGQRAAVSAQANAVISDREWEVLQLLGEGCSTAVMASRLRISEVTVRRHISTVVSKLGVSDRAAAAELMSTRSQR
jgi:DNA-binding NarL/FixJ family response regulator